MHAETQDEIVVSYNITKIANSLPGNTMTILYTIFSRTALLLVCLATVTSAYGQFWQETSGPPASASCMVADSQGWIYVGTAYSAVYRSSDRGTTWKRLDRGIDDGGAFFYVVNQLAVGVNDELFAAVNGKGIFRSRDRGETWTLLNINISVGPTDRLTVACKDLGNGNDAVFVGYDAGPPNLFMRYSSNSGESFVEIPRGNLPSAMSSIFETFLTPNSSKLFVLVSYNKGLYRSTDMGVNWRRIDSDPSSGESDDNFLTMRADRTGRLFIGRNALPGSTKSKNACLLRSSDDGETWQYIIDGWDNRDVTNNKVTGITFGPGQDVWAMTARTTGVFYSSNGGTNWVSRNEGLPNNGSGSGIVALPNGDVFVAPTGGPVYRKAGVTSIDESMPAVLQAVSVWPNPVRDQASVQFNVDRSSLVTMSVYTSSGMLVAEPLTARLEAGHHSVPFSTAELPNGIYRWVVRTGSDVSTGAVTVLR